MDFEEDIEFYRHAKRKAGDADDYANGRFLDAEDISIEIRHSIGDPGLVNEVPRGCYEDSEADNASHSTE